METRYRIYVSEGGQFKNPDAYEFVAEFADPRLANNYIHYMYGKKPWGGKDIIVREEKVHKQTELVKTILVVSVMGEYLNMADYDIK